MQRRQETQRLLAGRNEANPVEFASAFNLGTGALPVPGPSGGREATGGLSSSYSQAIEGIGQFAQKTFREAAKTRYERLAMDGAMAYQQGKAVDELDMDGNKWMLEGYRVMEAETVSTALFAAQQMEISQGLHEIDPDGFRDRYTQRVEQALSGHDERTQELIKSRMMEQMPRLVDQHTREHMQYREQQNFDALTASVAQMSIDPANSSKLLSFARGESGSEGLSEARRRGAVIRGIQTAYENDNPLAYSILKQHGVLDELTIEETQALRQAQQAYENRKMSEYDESFFRARQNLSRTIENGEFTDPHDAVAAYAALLSEHGITINYAAAQAAYGASMTAGQHHHRAITLEMETAKLNGDWDKVAELSSTFAEAAINQPTGTFYSAMGQFEAGGYDTLFGNSEGNRFPVRVSQMTIGQLKDFSSPSGEYGQWVASTRNDGRSGQVATPMGKFQIVGSTLRNAQREMGLSDDTVFTPAVQRDIAAHLAKSRLQSSTTMGGKIAALRQEWDGFNKASENTMVAIVQELEGTNSVGQHNYGEFNNERWTGLVSRFEGDLEMAAVAYAAGGNAQRARAWNEAGRPDDFLTSKEQAFMRKVTNEASGHRYVTAASRAVAAETVYNRVAEANAVDIYAQVEPQLRALDSAFVNGTIDKNSYLFQRDELYNEFDMQRTIQSINHELDMIESRTKAEIGVAEAQGDEEYARSLAVYNVQNEQARIAAEQRIEEIMSSMPEDGVSPEQHKHDQLNAISRINQEMIAGAQSRAEQAGIQFKDQGLERLVKEGIQEFARMQDRAQQQAMARAERDRAVNEGRLNRIPESQARQAYEEEVQRSIQGARRQSAGQENADRLAQDLHQDHMENWFARTGYIPQEMRDRHSAALMGELVVDGDINESSLDAITSYMSMKRKNSFAADEMLDPEAKVVAEAVIGLSGGNPENMPLVIKQLWAEGLERSFRGQPLPDFMERADVRSHINRSLQGTGMQRFMARLFGEQEGSFRALNLPPQEMQALQSVIENRIEYMHSLVPGMNPKYVVDMAMQNAADTIVAIPRVPDASFGQRADALVGGIVGGWRDMVFSPGSTNRSIGSVMANPIGNTFVMDPTGGNIRKDMFGAQGADYNMRHVGQAIDGYINSPEFRSRIGADFESGNYTLNHIGNGQIVIDVEPSGTTNWFGGELVPSFTEIVRVEEIGEWFKKQDRGELTGR